MTQSLSPTLAVGVIVRPHGVRGEVKIQPLTDTPADWLSIRTVEWTARDGSTVSRRVKQNRVQGEQVIVTIEGVYDRNAAELLRGTTLSVRREEAPVPAEGSYYIVDLIGCTVRDEEGHALAEITDVLQPGANDVYELKTPKGPAMMPAVRAVIRGVDIAARNVTVDAARFDEVTVYED